MTAEARREFHDHTTPLLSSVHGYRAAHRHRGLNAIGSADARPGNQSVARRVFETPSQYFQIAIVHDPNLNSVRVRELGSSQRKAGQTRDRPVIDLKERGGEENGFGWSKQGTFQTPD